MAVPTTIMSSRPSAAILIISPSSMSEPCGLLTQGPPIAHLSNDAELKIGSHVARTVPYVSTGPDRAGCGYCRLGARCDWRSDRGWRTWAESFACPAARQCRLRMLAELIADTGLASESRDLARRGARVTSLTEI